MLLLCTGIAGGIIPCASGNLQHHSTAKPDTAAVSGSDGEGWRSYSASRYCRAKSGETGLGDKAKLRCKPAIATTSGYHSRQRCDGEKLPCTSQANSAAFWKQRAPGQ